MKRCYELEHSEELYRQGKISLRCSKEIHCGNGVTIDGVRYCQQDGRLGKGYFGWCAAKDPPKGYFGEQMTFFDT